MITINGFIFSSNICCILVYSEYFGFLFALKYKYGETAKIILFSLVNIFFKRLGSYSVRDSVKYFLSSSISSKEHKSKT